MADNRELRDSSSLQTVPSPFRERVRERERSQGWQRCVGEVRNPLPSPLPEGRGSLS